MKKGKGRPKKNMGSSSDTKETEVEEGTVLCGECKLEVADEGLQCEVCERWYHLKCQDVTEEVYKILDQECIHWYCKGCNKRVAKLVKAVAKLEERQDRLEEELEETKGEVKEVKDEVKKLDGIKDEIKRLDLRITDMSGASVAARETGGLRREDVLEEIEIERRKMNLVVSGLKEGNNDEEEIKECFSKLAGVKGVRSIVNIERIGKRVVSKVRPVRVILNNMEGRMELLKQAHGLKGYEEYKKVYIAPDLTRKQLEKDKALRAKLIEFRQQKGEKDAKISKGRIVKKSNGSEVVLYPTPPPDQVQNLVQN